MTDALAIALDPDMTPDAVRISLFYASLGPGEHPYDADMLSQLLEEAGEKRIRKALKRAERCGYLIRHHGGQHTDRFTFSPPQAAGERVSPPSLAGDNPVSPPQAAGESIPPTTTATPPPPYSPPKGSDGLEMVRAYLGDEAVDVATNSVLTPSKLRGVVGLYGPSGTQTDRVLGGLSPGERRKALATAVMRMAMDAKQYSNPLFEKYLKRAMNGKDTDGTQQQRGTGTDGRPSHRGSSAPDGGEAPRAERGQRFAIE